MSMVKDVQNRGYKGSYLFGVVAIGVVAVRGLSFYSSQPNLITYALLLGVFTLFYSLSPTMLDRFERFPHFYFPIQTLVALFLGNLQPPLDVTNLLYIVLGMQVIHAFPRRAVNTWIALYVILLSTTLVLGTGWMEGLTLSLFYLAGAAFLISYDLLYWQTKVNQTESQALLSELQNAHQQLKEYAAQAEELASARERNRLARELHDTVSQSIFSIALMSRSAQMLLVKEPERLPEQLDQMQKITIDSLKQLRSLIAQLRPPEKPDKKTRE